MSTSIPYAWYLDVEGILKQNPKCLYSKHTSNYRQVYGREWGWVVEKGNIIAFSYDYV